jgi:acetyl esterase/lipase
MKMRCRSLRIILIWASAVSALGAFSFKDVVVKPDQVFGHKYGLAMTFDVYSPTDANGAAVLFINSGGYISGQFRQCEKGEDSVWRFIPIDPISRWPLPRLLLEQYSFERLLAAGFTVFDIRHGSSPKFTIDEMFEDGSRAVRFIRFHAREYGIDAERMGLWGGSAGGHLALLLGARVVEGKANNREMTGSFEANGFAEPELEVSSRVKTVGVYYPAGYDLRSDFEAYPEVFKSLPALNVATSVLDEFSIKNHLGKTNPPVLIIYGDQDFPMIIGASKNTAADLDKLGREVKTVVLPGVAHEFKGKDGYKNAEPGRIAMDELVKWFNTKLIKNIRS